MDRARTRLPRRQRLFAWVATLALLVWCAAPALAQTARKPSPYEYRQGSNAAVQPTQGPDYLSRIDSRAQFMQLARVYNAGTALEMPHLIFVIDRQNAARIYYINTPRHALHEEFVQRQRLVRAMDKATLNAQYRDPQRRFLFGTLSWQRDLPGYTYEFWEGDKLTAALLRQTDEVVRASFRDPIRFKTNSTQHEQLASSMGLAYVSQEALLREQRFLPLNTGRAEGRLRIVRSEAQLRTLSPRDIPVLDEVPIALAPVAGLVTQRPSTLLSHVNLLAKGWGIPNVYVRDAQNALRQYDGRWVALEVTHNDYRVTPLARPPRTPSATAARPAARNLPRPDLTVVALKPLAALRARDSSHCGVKAANLGTLKAALPPAARVPDGFCIPFSHYQAMMQRLRIPQRLQELQRRPGFGTDSNIRRDTLAALRAEIADAAPDPAFVRALDAQWRSQLQGGAVFVRSSSNSEDLPGFSGAGLYTTVPNVTRADALAKAVQTVWASVYNFEAYEARTAAGLGQDAVAMAVLVQLAAPSDSSGVMITRDPFDAARRHITYISAKRGLGIRVVEGKRQAEQVMYSNWSKAVQVLSRSAEDTQLVANAAGGVREIPITGSRQVLTDALIARLAKVGASTKQALGGADQDIEWAVVGDEVVILQSRPYVDRSAP
ncbi:PEP/pyruvate-binding domain-containing protein [Xanthomonas sp. NCPPB 2654]|uniref:PEP/pyruvate-binding domain-containing protein n=1 Tax=unclassified Xanthomonas TaxID=2643310 RepID=UPI0021E06E20|nr:MULTISPECIES: PEP/pyruvate-binding domain-containing protein [unclassified Xanthomonas]MDL5366804.1 PEP/pyruvate-binding domain-containing protein [Xanthomonas sp. NCPPB 2654]UYC20077.1 pyruvate, phosphate dikinase [Xanthomonas sp. CFBP 8443]